MTRRSDVPGEQRPPGFGTACGTRSAGMAATNGGATETGR